MTKNQQVWDLIGGCSDAHIERLRKVNSRVLPAGCVMTASLLFSTRFANGLYTTSTMILTLALLAASLALHLWPRSTLRTLRTTLFALLLGLNVGLAGSFHEAIHADPVADLELSNWLYGVSLLIIGIHTLFSPLGAKFAALALWIEATLAALVGLAFYWQAGGPMEQATLETMRFVISGGVTIGMMEVFSQLSAVQLRNEVQNSLLEYRAYTDALTELPNRRAFQAQSKNQFDVARRRESPMSLIAVDIDCFKSINDAHGHDAGDHVLQHIAGAIRSMTDSLHYPVRWGGDEFAVLLPGCDLEQAEKVAERLRAGIAALAGQTNNATVSIGVAQYQEGDCLERLFKRADQGLYRAKRLGRNRVAAGPEPFLPPLPIEHAAEETAVEPTRPS